MPEMIPAVIFGLTIGAVFALALRELERRSEERRKCRDLERRVREIEHEYSVSEWTRRPQ